MGSTRRNLVLVLLQGNAKFVIDSVSVVVLARLLTPAEIGVFSIAYGFVAMAHIFRELGVNVYVIQERELTTDRLRAAFAVSLVMAWLVAAVLALGSSWIASFYHTRELRGIVLLLAFNFLLVPFGAITMTVLRRDLDFARLLTINLTSALAGTVTSIVLAAMGVGSMSLAWGSTAGLAVTVALCAVVKPSAVPRLPGLKEVRRVLSFGAWTTGGAAVSQAGISAPDMIIGKVLGATDTGLFSKAFGIVNTFHRLVLQAVSNFATPHFSARIRDGLEVRETYLHAASLITGLAWPFFTVVALCAVQVVQLLLGDQWTAAAPVARVLCLSAAVSAPFAPFPNLLIAASGAKAFGSYMAVAALARILAVLASAWLGLQAVAWALIVASIVAAIPALHSLNKRIGISPAQLWRATQPSLTVSLASLAGAALSGWAASMLPWMWLRLCLSLTGAGIGWLAAVRVWRHPLWHELELAIGPVLRRLAKR